MPDIIIMHAFASMTISPDTEVNLIVQTSTAKVYALVHMRKGILNLASTAFPS